MTKNKITEDAVEQLAIELLEEQGYYCLTPEVVMGGQVRVKGT